MRDAKEIMFKFLMEGYDLPCKKSNKDELWEWIVKMRKEVNLIRRFFLAHSANTMVEASNPLYSAVEALFAALDESDPEWRRSTLGGPIENKVTSAWERLHNTMNTLG